MKVDITVQLILFVINICLATGAVIYYRKATKLKDEAGKLMARLDAHNNSLNLLRERIERCRYVRLKKMIPVPEYTKFDSIERSRFLVKNLDDMTKELALNMRKDGLIKVESISEEKDTADKTKLVLEIAAQVLPPQNNQKFPL